MANPRSNQPTSFAPPPSRISFASEDRVAGGGSLPGSGDGFNGAPDRAVWAPYDYGDAHRVSSFDKRERETGFSVCLWLHFPSGGGAGGEEEFWDRLAVYAGGKQDRGVDVLGSLARFWPSDDPEKYTWVPPRRSNGEWDFDGMDGDEEAMLAAAGRYLLPAPLPNGEHQNPSPSVLNSCDAALWMDALERAGYPKELVNAAMLNSCDASIFAGADDGTGNPWSAAWGRLTKTELKRLSGIEGKKAKTGSEMAKGKAADEKDMLVPLSVTMETAGGKGKSNAAGKAKPVASAAQTSLPATGSGDSDSGRGSGGSGEFDADDPESIVTLGSQIIEWLAETKDGSMARALLAVKLAQKHYKSNQQPVTKWINNPENLATIDGIKVEGSTIKLA